MGPKKKIWVPKVFGGGSKKLFGRRTPQRGGAGKKKKQKKTRFFRLGAEKYDFRAPKEQRPIIGALLTRYIFPRNLSDFSEIS